MYDLRERLPRRARCRLAILSSLKYHWTEPRDQNQGQELVAIPRRARIASFEAIRRWSRGKESLRLWLRLLALEGMIEQDVRRMLRDQFAVTLPQFDVLAELEHAGRPLTMSQLSDELVVSNGNVTGVVDRLERDGLVRRESAPDDRRVHRIGLTDEGAQRFARMASAHEQLIAELFAGLTEAEIRSLQALLHKAKESITARADRGR